MTEVRLYPAGTVPECVTAEWYAEREHAPHLEQDLHRPRLELAAQFAADLSADLDGANVVDIGAGDGGLLWLLRRRGVAGHGYDLQPTNVAAAAARGVSVVLVDAVGLLPYTAARAIVAGAAARGVDVPSVAAILDEHAVEHGELELAPIAVATEVLEHLVDPHLVLRQLAAAGVDALVASSPWTETAGAAYEFHLWAWDEAGYRELLERNGWHVVRQELAGMFQVVAAVRAELEQVAR